MRLMLGIFSFVLAVNAFAADPSDSYRTQPPDYTRAEFPHRVGNKFLQPMMWTKCGEEGGVRSSPPSGPVHNEVERRQAAGWRPFQFYVAQHGLPIPELRWVPDTTPYSLTREQAISMVTDTFLADPKVGSARIARDMAVRYVDSGYRFRKRLIRQKMRPSANSQMVACWNKQTAIVEAFVRRFAFSKIHDEFLKSGAGPSINPWINIQHVWVPGAKNTHQGGKRADIINGTIVIVPGGVDRGVNCATASVSEIWGAVARVLWPISHGEAHPDAGLPAHMAQPLFGLKVLAGSTPFRDEAHRKACIIEEYY